MTTATDGTAVAVDPVAVPNGVVPGEESGSRT